MPLPLEEPARLLLRCAGGPETQPAARQGSSARAGVRVVVRGRNAQGGEVRGRIFRAAHLAGKAGRELA